MALVPTKVGQSCDSLGIENGERNSAASDVQLKDACEKKLMPGGVKISLAEATIPLVGDTEKGSHRAKGITSLMKSLPTPARSKAAAHGGAAGKSIGPAPWEATTNDAAGMHSGYREMLQLRGQQAMQRSRMRDLPPPPSMPAARLPPILEASTAAPNVSSCSPLATMPQPGWSCNYQVSFFPQQDLLQQHVPSAVEQLCGLGLDDSTDATRAASAVMLPISREFGFAAAQESVPQGPVTPQNHPSTSAESPCTPQELMSAVMGSGAFAFDDEQIAEALRAAAPCEYDD